MLKVSYPWPRNSALEDYTGAQLNECGYNAAIVTPTGNIDTDRAAISKLASCGLKPVWDMAAHVRGKLLGSYWVQAVDPLTAAYYLEDEVAPDWAQQQKAVHDALKGFGATAPTWGNYAPMAIYDPRYDPLYDICDIASTTYYAGYEATDDCSYHHTLDELNRVLDHLRLHRGGKPVAILFPTFNKTNCPQAEGFPILPTADVYNDYMERAKARGLNVAGVLGWYHDANEEPDIRYNTTAHDVQIRANVREFLDGLTDEAPPIALDAERNPIAPDEEVTITARAATEPVTWTLKGKLLGYFGNADQQRMSVTFNSYAGAVGYTTIEATDARGREGEYTLEVRKPINAPDLTEIRAAIVALEGDYTAWLGVGRSIADQIKRLKALVQE